MSIRITKLVIETFVQMTEDRELVEKAILNCLKGEEKGDFSFTEIKGHFGNKIILLKFISKTPIKAFKSLINQLNQTCPIESLFESKVTGNKIFLRLDKQMAFMGKLITANSNDILRIKISFSGKQNEIIDFLRSILEDSI